MNKMANFHVMAQSSGKVHYPIDYERHSDPYIPNYPKTLCGIILSYENLIFDQPVDCIRCIQRMGKLGIITD